MPLPHNEWSREAAKAARDWMATMPTCCDDIGFTYLVEAAGLIKIGRTDDLRDRLTGLVNTSPVKLTLLAAGRGDVENFLHTRLHQHRHHGEWFDAQATRRWLTDLWIEEESREYCLSCLVRNELR